MSRRLPYSKVNKHNRVQSSFAVGKGDKAYRGFNCLNPECNDFIFIEDKIVQDNIAFNCPSCRYQYSEDGKLVIFDYELVSLTEGDILETGEFEISHKEYLQDSQHYKYCTLCNTYKPYSYFDKHAARDTGRQGECNLCKQKYNTIKNKTRLSEQHFEAAQKRRLFSLCSGQTGKIRIDAIFKKYSAQCFNCNKSLGDENGEPIKGAYNLDHTLPVFYLWPASSDNMTLLCKSCNGDKAEEWPATYYNDTKLRSLSALTGLDYRILAGQPHFNPESIARLENKDGINKLVNQYGPYIQEIIKLRNRIFRDTQVDIFKNATELAQKWIDDANNELR